MKERKIEKGKGEEQEEVKKERENIAIEQYFIKAISILSSSDLVMTSIHL